MESHRCVLSLLQVPTATAHHSWTLLSVYLLYACIIWRYASCCQHMWSIVEFLSRIFRHKTKGLLYIFGGQSNVCVSTFLIPSCTCYEIEGGGSRLHRNVTHFSRNCSALVSQIQRPRLTLLFRTARTATPVPRVWGQGRIRAIYLPTFRRSCL